MKKIVLFVFIPLWLLLVCGSAWSFAQPDWRDSAWQFRRKFSVYSTQGRQIGNTAYAELVTGGSLQADGFDLRIYDNRGVVTPYKMLFCSPYGVSFVAFKADEKYEPYTFYFGCNVLVPSQEPAEEWEPKGGLILREWEATRGIVNSWEDMQNMFANKGKVIGAGLRRNIFDSYSPYNYTVPHLSLYEGYLIINKPGKFKLAASSDGPSFLLIDGFMIVQWPGGHNASWQGDHYTVADLEKGLHKFELYWQALWGMDAQKLAVSSLTDWKNPARKYNYYQPIPREQFLDAWKAEPQALEAYNKTWCADFVFRQTSFLPSDFGFMLFYAFEAVEREGHIYEWDFGDGEKAEGAQTEHIFLSSGKYRVTLRESGEDGVEDVLSVTVSTVCEPKLTDYNYNARLKSYVRVMREYSFDKLQLPQLLLIWDCAKNLQDAELLLRLGKKMLPFLFTALRGWRSNLNVLKLSNRIAESLTGDDPLSNELAKDIYKELINEVYDDREKREVRRPLIDASLKLADLHLEKLRDYDAAIEEYSRLLDYKISYSENLQIYTGIGDAWLLKGDPGKAKEYYNKVYKEKEYTYEQEIALEGSLAQQVDEYLQTKELDGAKNSLAEWDESIPWKKLEPYYWLLKGRYFYQSKKYKDALFHLDMAIKLSTVIKVLLPEILYYQRQSFLGLGDFTSADSVSTQLKVAYPDSPWIK